MFGGRCPISGDRSQRHCAMDASGVAHVDGYSEDAMSTLATPLLPVAPHPVGLGVDPALNGRNRLTTAFRLVLALPHLVLVGGPVAGVVSWTWGAPRGDQYQGGFGGGVFGAVAAMSALIAWFAIL